MSAYDELVERAARKAICGQMESGRPLWVFLADHNKTAADLHGPIRAALAEVFRTLENVTPEMVNASYELERDTFGPMARGLKHSVILETMLRASPLAAPAEKERGI